MLLVVPHSETPAGKIQLEDLVKGAIDLLALVIAHRHLDKVKAVPSSELSSLLT